MMQIHKRRLSLVVTMLLLVALSMAAGAQTETKTLRVLMPQGAWYIPYVARSIADFEAQFPGTKVELTMKSELPDAIMAEYMAGLSNDVLLMGSIVHNVWRNIVSQGFVLDHFPFLNADTSIDRSEFFPPLFDAFVYRGELVGIPMEATTAATFANRTLFDEHGVHVPEDGWDWYDLRNIARTLTKRSADDTSTVQWGFGTDGFSLNYLGATPFLWSNGADIVNADRTRVTLLAPEAQEAMQFFYDLIFLDEVAPPPGSNQPALFWTGQLALWDSASWNLAYNRQNAQPHVDWDLIPPVRSPHTGQSAPLVSGHIAAISSTSQHPELAWELIKFLFIDDNAQMQVAAEGMLPTRKSFATYYLDTVGSPPANIMPIVAAASEGRTPVWFDDPQVNQAVWDIVAREWDQVLNRTITVRAFAEKATPLIEALIGAR